MILALVALLFIASPAVSHAEADKAPLKPSELFSEFPAVTFEMDLATAKKVVAASGAHPVSRNNELAWDGTFSKLFGRATLLFREDGKMFEMAVIVQAVGKRQEVYNRILQKITERHGDPDQSVEDSVSSSKLWKLSEGIILELRVLKEESHPAIDVHWVTS